MIDDVQKRPPKAPNAFSNQNLNLVSSINDADNTQGDYLYGNGARYNDGQKCKNPMRW